jgi:hypothetical protein
MAELIQLYHIQLPNGNYTYVYQDFDGNFVLEDENGEEIPYYVNDLKDFYDNSIREI